MVEDRYIPEESVEVYFKAADALVVPYRRVSQSGVVFLSYGFGLPVIVSDAGALAEAVEVGTTGLVFRSEDAGDLGRQIQAYFASDLFRSLEHYRDGIIRRMNEKHSWTAIAAAIAHVYEGLSLSALDGRTAGAKTALDSRPQDETR